MNPIRVLDVLAAFALLGAVPGAVFVLRGPPAAPIVEPIVASVRNNPSSWRPTLASRTGYIPVRTASGGVYGGWTSTGGGYGGGGYRSGK